ncbi:hypothetical protein [Pseudactinotalea sp. HY158]|uniref:hypothetical protein n=1 Tax=Pseudactinotalea sp. HY158 TaxID=2654547 RepID=UPI00129C96C9|nr:hypothetical protein [Pseudactinotalea sp. HY158]QGH70625.1 hypothetical protein GCE65_14845 [Pseudactinotalea sp. HY158]
MVVSVIPIGWARRLLTAAALVLVAAGCQASSAGGTELPNGLQVPRSSGGTPGVGDGALLEGRIVDRDGCLAVESELDGSVAIPVFDVEDPRPDRLAPGGGVAFGGGFQPPHDSFDIPSACAGEDEYFLVVME